MKKLCILVLVLTIIISHTAVFAEDRHAPRLDSDNAAFYVITDVLFIRPLAFVGFIGGTVIFVATLPVAVATQSIERSKQTFVLDPYDYTFKRPLGDVRGEKNY